MNQQLKPLTSLREENTVILRQSINIMYADDLPGAYSKDHPRLASLLILCVSKCLSTNDNIYFIGLDIVHCENILYHAPWTRAALGQHLPQPQPVF